METLKEKLAGFVKERDWDQYHNPKNLVLSLVSEVGELAEIFRWLTSEESSAAMETPQLAHQIEEELADVFNNLVLLAMKLKVNLLEVAEKKLDLNAVKYPKELWNGKSHIPKNNYKK